MTTTSQSPENALSSEPCTALLHIFGKLALQTADMDAHNDAIRSIIAEGFKITGPFAILNCDSCLSEVKIPTERLCIDPLA